MQFQIKMCEECKQACTPLVSKSRPKSSEWYCQKCHKSYTMTVEEANFLNQHVNTTDVQER